VNANVSESDAETAEERRKQTLKVAADAARIERALRAAIWVRAGPLFGLSIRRDPQKVCPFVEDARREFWKFLRYSRLSTKVNERNGLFSTVDRENGTMWRWRESLTGIYRRRGS
jgi:hypothetical protein